MKWKYQIIKFEQEQSFLGGKFNGEVIENKLNELGAEGWELVSLMDTNSGYGASNWIIAILKRPVE
jgi:hypothetical protein